METQTVPTGREDAAAPQRDGLMRVRPRLGHDVLFADLGDGTLLRNSQTGFVVKGRTAYRFTATLAPHLTGEHTVAELCSNLSDEQQAMVTDLVRTLLDKGLARDSKPSAPVDLPQPVLDRFHAQINYVEHYADDAAARFARFRAANILVLGNGTVARSATLSLMRNGTRTVDLAPGARGAYDQFNEIESEARALDAAGCEATIRRVDFAADTVDAVQLAPYAAVIAPAEDIGPAAVRRLSRLCTASGPVLLPMAVVGEDVILGPLVRQGSAPCWTCAALRLGANLEPGAIAALWRDISLPELANTRSKLSAPLAGMVGNMLGYEAFRLITGCMPADTEDAVIIQDRTTLEAEREPLLVHPLCPECREYQVDSPPATITRDVLTAPVADADYGPDADNEELRQRFERNVELVQPHVGVLAAFDDTSLDQIPLKVSRIRLGAGDCPGVPERMVTAFDLHTALSARTRAVEAAVGVYIDTIANAREAVTSSRRELAGDRTTPAALHRELATSSGRVVGQDEEVAWLPAHSLLSGEPKLVPAAVVYPFSGWNAGLTFEPTAAGNGVGDSLAGAVRTGLLSALAYNALRGAASGRAIATQVAIDAQEPGSELDFLLRTARNLNLPFDLIDLAPAAPAHLVLARTTGHSEPRWAIGTGLKGNEARVAALRDLIGQAQLRCELGEDIVVDVGDPLLMALDVRAIHADSAARAEGRSDTTVSALLSDLRSQGRDVLVVPTTTPDLQRRGGLVAVRVLLATQ